jgi:hypothetical protein
MKTIWSIQNWLRDALRHPLTYVLLVWTLMFLATGVYFAIAD